MSYFAVHNKKKRESSLEAIII